ncbi:ATP-binding cassette sub-family G member 8-like [Tubulanus polymorphus]|uniref:ATP-binding cassette sub-family G member 8-like n=1 Tax=Tubulanus polymorphus TaxID=672921 RepID=UPI003DA46CC5
MDSIKTQNDQPSNDQSTTVVHGLTSNRWKKIMTSMKRNISDPPLTLEAHNINYHIDPSKNTWTQRFVNVEMPWEWTTETNVRRKVLNDISFSVTSAHLLAILGGSGSGKTSLLNVLSQRADMSGVSGSVLIDGSKRDLEYMRDFSAYVMQDDFFMPQLTVTESLTFIAKLKLPSEFDKNDIKEQVNSLITELGLAHVANSKIGGEKVRGISGGERRRVSIAMQLLLDPKILFLDEPTSGLDSFTAYNLVEMLAKLAQKDKLVVMTIHQPRSNIFELFDQVMILTEGNIAYYGDAKRMSPYFESIGYKCPDHTNPCDFYVDIASLDRKSPRTEAESRKRVDKLIDAHRRNNVYARAYIFDGTEYDDIEAGFTPSSLVSSHDSASSKPPVVKHISTIQKFSVLTRRAILNHVEDYGFLLVQSLEALMMSLLLGVIFWQLQCDQDGVKDRFGLMFLIGGLYPYMIISDVIGDYCKEVPIFYREIQDGLYTVGPYFFSKILSELPEHSAFMILYSIPMYWMANLQADASLFFRVFGVTYMLVYCSRILSLFTAALMPSYQSAIFVTQAIYISCLLSSGYLVNMDNIMAGMKWFTNLSFTRWGYLGLCQTEMPGLNFTCTNLSSITCISTGEEALKSYSVDDYSVDIAVVAMWGWIFAFLMLFYICLKFIPQKPRD